MKTFTVMQYSYRDEEGSVRRINPHAIPFDIIKKYEPRALKNHYQTLDKLNSRGGCSCIELWMIINDVDFVNMDTCPYKTDKEAHEWLKEFIEKEIKQ